MPRQTPNAPRWNGCPGHYEVWYLTLTDGRSGVGMWIRYTMTAPASAPGEAALWFVAADPRGGIPARKTTHPIGDLHASAAPFELRRRAPGRQQDGRRVRRCGLGTCAGRRASAPMRMAIRWRSGSAWPRACSSLRTPTWRSKDASSTPARGSS